MRSGGPYERWKAVDSLRRANTLESPPLQGPGGQGRGRRSTDRRRAADRQLQPRFQEGRDIYVDPTPVVWRLAADLCTGVDYSGLFWGGFWGLADQATAKGDATRLRQATRAAGRAVVRYAHPVLVEFELEFEI